MGLTVSQKHQWSLTILSGEKRLAAEHLSEDTADRPHIDGLGVLLESQHDLRRTVPSSRDIFGHETRVILLRGSGSRKTEIADLEITVGVEEEVGGLQVSVQHVGRVHRLEGSEGLVDEVLAVVVGKILCADDTVHIRLHQLLQCLLAR
ncbi:hypothetical protein HG531_006032 [Fusarium graminearum]|nr:hypothetical protein HG531_006032 [Fusarium graminearum]